jgi:hypothetical protein
MNGLRQSKDFGNGVRPCTALGFNRPIWRLGALVSLPYVIGNVILVQRTGWEFVAEANGLQALAGKTFSRSWPDAAAWSATPQRGRPKVFQNKRKPKRKALTNRIQRANQSSLAGIARG